jgi:hypothetical protein
VTQGTHLLSNDRQHGELDAVELVEAAPDAGATQALEHLRQVREALLVCAVRDDDELPERATQILDRLGLAGASRARGSAAEVHAQSL